VLKDLFDSVSGLSQEIESIDSDTNQVIKKATRPPKVGKGGKKKKTTTSTSASSSSKKDERDTMLLLTTSLVPPKLANSKVSAFSTHQEEGENEGEETGGQRDLRKAPSSKLKNKGNEEIGKFGKMNSNNSTGNRTYEGNHEYLLKSTDKIIENIHQIISTEAVNNNNNNSATVTVKGTSQQQQPQSLKPLQNKKEKR
jgi:hypothetical protein